MEKIKRGIERARAAAERWNIHHALTNSASVARVRVRAHTNERECVQRSVSSRRAWNGRERRAVSAPHPEIPFETNPSHRDELFPSLLSLCRRLFPLTSRSSIPLRTSPFPDAVSTSKAPRVSHESTNNKEELVYRHTLKKNYLSININATKFNRV